MHATHRVCTTTGCFECVDAKIKVGNNERLSDSGSADNCTSFARELRGFIPRGVRPLGDVALVCEFSYVDIND
jgi:hypothetical protein